MDSLALPQQETVNEFIAITDISGDDETLSKVIALLSSYDFNLNNSVLAFFDRGLDLPAQPQPESELLPSFESASGVDRFESTAVHRNLQSEFVMNHLFPNLMKAPKIPNRWVSDLATHEADKEPDEKGVSDQSKQAQMPSRKSSVWWMILLAFPKTLAFLLTALRYIFRFNSISYESKSSKFDYLNYDASYSILKQLEEPTADSLSQCDVVSEQFNENHDHCQKNYSFLLSILVDDSSVAMIDILFSDASFRSLFNKSTGEFKDTRIYLGNIDKSPEALEIAQVYKYRSVPYIFAAANVSRDPTIMSSMSLIYKANCYFCDEEERRLLVGKVVKAIKKSFAEFNPQLLSKRYNKQEMEFSRLLKERQDEAYLESLSNDKMKKKEKELKRQTEYHKVQMVRKKSAYLQYLVQSEYFVNQTAEGNASNSVRIAIKLPDGKRHVQKFLKSSPVCDIYLFAELQMLESDSNEVESMHIDYDDYLLTISFKFEMFKVLPKCVIPISRISIEEFEELKSGDTVLLENFDDSEEEAKYDEDVRTVTNQQ